MQCRLKGESVRTVESTRPEDIGAKGYIRFMERTHDKQIAIFEETIALLRQRHRQIRSLLPSTLTAPQVRRSARAEFEAIMREIGEGVERLSKLQAPQ